MLLSLLLLLLLLLVVFLFLGRYFSGEVGGIANSPEIEMGRTSEVDTGGTT